MKTLLIALGLIALLAGCGNPPTPPVVSLSAFPVQAAYKAYLLAGATTNFTATAGLCTGTATITTSKPVAATFAGKPGFAITETDSLASSNCNPSALTVTVVTNFDSNYNLLGGSIAGVQYAELVAPFILPVYSKVGDTAVLGTLNLFTNSSKTSSMGKAILSYAIEPDTATTAIINMTAKMYDVSNALTNTTIMRFKIDGAGVLTYHSVDVNTDVLRVILTKI